MLPSERIGQIMNKRPWTESAERASIFAIVQYLDEQYQKEKSDGAK